MGRHAGKPTPFQLLCEAALAYANAEDDREYELAEYRLRYAARYYRDNPGKQPSAHPGPGQQRDRERGRPARFAPGEGGDQKESE